jgi:hypothetical protein
MIKYAARGFVARYDPAVGVPKATAEATVGALLATVAERPRSDQVLTSDVRLRIMCRIWTEFMSHPWSTADGKEGGHVNLE